MKRIILALALIGLITGILSAKQITLKDLINPASIDLDPKHIYITEGVNIYIYDRETLKLKLKFGKKGEGPEEFMADPNTGVAPLKIDVKTDWLFVNSFNKVSYFTKDGEYKKEKRYGGRTNTYLPFADGFVSQMLTRGEGGMFWKISVYDSEFKEKKELIKIKHHYQGRGKGYKVFQESRAQSIDGNKIFLCWEPGFNISVYDSDGKKLYNITREYERPEFTAVDRKTVVDAWKNDPNKRLYEMLKPIITPDVYPALQRLEVNNGKIYAVTFKKNDKKHTECLIMDLKGKLLKTVFLDLEHLNTIDLYPYAIDNETLYQLVETDEETWALNIKKLK